MRLYKSQQPGFQQVPPQGAEHPLLTGKMAVGLMSGQNPRFPSAPGENVALKRDLEAMGLKHEETDGRYGMPERSFIVYGPTREQMYQLGQKYGQESVVHSAGGQHELLYTNGEHAGKSNPGTGTYDYWPEGAEPPEDYYTKLPGQGYLRLHFDFDQFHHKPLAVQPAVAPTPQVTKHDIGHALYNKLTKALGGIGLAKSMAHPLAYDWHDGHTDHHFAGGCMGGVLVSKLKKHDAPGASQPVQHPHTDGAIPNQQPKNDQAAGVGVKTYAQFALPFGHIDHEAKKRGGSNLFHYDYNGKNPAVDKLVADHGFQTYYAGGKFGKPDLNNRNYNTKHLMVYDPTPQSGGDFGDQTYTDSWRKVHELSHGLTYPELNKLYGEGRRIGKLGHHRTLREALRAVHWEWLAAHKQRELNRSLGIEVPDEVFNRELNTVMHDAAHRAVTGKFTEPSGEGFVPHAHKVPLETSLGLVREAARNLGLQGDHDLLRKSEDMANDKENDKNLTVPQALERLHKGLKDRIEQFAQGALELRKKETEALEKNVQKAAWMPATHQAAPAGGAKKPEPKVGGGSKMLSPDAPKEARTSSGKVIKNPFAKNADCGPDMQMSEACKLCGEKGCDCSKAEAYAKGELPMDKPGKPVASKLDEGSGGDIEKGKGLKKGAMPGAAPAAPKPKMPMGNPGGPAAGAMGGGAAPAMPKMPKLPGMGKPAAPAAGAPKPGGALPMPKAGPMSGAVPKTPKPPAMGAGAPAAKAEMQKNDPVFADGTSRGAPVPGVASLSPGKAKPQNLLGAKLPQNPADVAPGLPKAAAPAGLAPVISSAPAPGAKPAAVPPPIPAAALKQPPASAVPSQHAGGLPDLSNFQSLAKPAGAAPKLPGAHLFGKTEMKKDEFGPEATMVGKKPKADPPLKPLVPQGQLPGQQAANIKAAMAKRPK